jgi:RNA polymerase sigma-B factor
MSHRDPVIEAGKRLWSEYGSDPSRGLREQLIEHYRPLAMAILRRILRRSDEDMEQVAMLALVKAVDRFDPGRGYSFPSFAVPTIQGEIKRYLRDHTRLIRCPRSLQRVRDAVIARSRDLTRTAGCPPSLAEVAAALNIDLDTVVEAMAVDDTCRPCSLNRLMLHSEQDQAATLEECVGAPDPELERVEERVSCSQMLRVLAPKLEEVLRLRYQDNLSQKEVAHRLGVSQMQISRLERRALDCLRGEVAVG